MRDLCEVENPAAVLRAADGERLGSLADILANTPETTRDTDRPWLLAPIDLQAIKAAGVTFAVSMLERVIEERARGDMAAAAVIRQEITALVGEDFSRLKPGSPEAMHLKSVLLAQNAWSQYLEVGIGPDAEIFTKAQPMAAVGTGADAGILEKSHWNNPEPEVVLVVASDGRIVGATLGNDVNLRDIEGRSALLLGKAKDNNASCALGPFLRFFDGTFGLDDVRSMEITLTVDGPEGYRLKGGSSMRKISRDPRRPRGADDRPRTTAIPTAPCSSSARCSRRSRIATSPARGSRTGSATSSRCPPPRWVVSPTASAMRMTARPGPSGRAS